MPVAGNLLYFGTPLGTASINLRKLQTSLNMAINLVLFAYLVSALAFVVFKVFTDTEVQSLLSDILAGKGVISVWIWTAVIAGMYLFYHLSLVDERSKSFRTLKKDHNDIFGNLSSWEDVNRIKKHKIIDISHFMDIDAFESLENSFLLANGLRRSQVDPIHVFCASMTTRNASRIFFRLGMLGHELFETISRHLKDGGTEANSCIMSNETKIAVLMAAKQAIEWKQEKLSIGNLLTAMAESSALIQDILKDKGLSIEMLQDTVFWQMIDEKRRHDIRRFHSLAAFKPSGRMDRAYTAIATPLLDSFSHDLCLAALRNNLEYCVARDAEIRMIFDALGSGHFGIMLIGENGVGKEAIIHGLAELMVEERVPSLLRDKRLLQLDAARLISGADAALAEAKLLSAIDEINLAGNIVLYIKDIECLSGISSGSGGSLDLLDVLISAVEKHELIVFCSVDAANYIKHLESGPLDKSFAKVEIKEPDKRTAIKIIAASLPGIEATYSRFFAYSAIDSSVELSKKYLHEQRLPDKALRILESAASKHSNSQEGLVNGEDVAAVVSELCGVPLRRIGKEESKDLLELESRMHERMVGQPDAVSAIASCLRRARTALRDEARPIASFLFLGPTGVGKTELAKTLAETYFGSETYMIRLDMSEYQDAGSAERIIGKPGEKGFLTEEARKRPFSLILLDEIEKAHPDIMNLFLQVFDDGRLTDGQGQTADFRNSIIIATSNIGAIFIQEEIRNGSDTKTISAQLIDRELSKAMRPELINRFDDIIVFEPLSRTSIKEITRLHLGKLAVMLEQKGIELRISDGGLRILSEQAYDPKFGARPLRRLIQEKIENRIAELLLSGELARRDILHIEDDASLKVEKAKSL